MAKVIIPTCKLDVSTPKFPNTYVKISPEDFPRFSGPKWCLDSDGYAVRWKRTEERKQSAIYMHRQASGADKGHVVDHRNRNRLDNRRENLRFCSKLQNAHNSRTRTTQSGFRGVFLEQKTGLYRAEINMFGEKVRLGTYQTAHEAAAAYDLAAIRVYGDFAGVNFPQRYRQNSVNMMDIRYWLHWFRRSRVLCASA